MKGIILVGGEGTRLRPLTLTHPKPLIPFGNKPIVKHQIEALVSVGVSEVILAVGYMHEIMKSELEQYSKNIGIKITYSKESIPMGTAGPLSLLRSILEKEEEPFFVLNSDIICSFPFKQIYRCHMKRKSAGTILVTKVQDPSKYGVVLSSPEGVVTQFVEKPSSYVGDMINAGIYLFNREILKYIESRPMSIEKEVLPLMAERQELGMFPLSGYWMDIGQPKDYLLGHSLFLLETQSAFLIDPTAKVSERAQIKSNTVIGPGVRVEEEAEVEGSIILAGAHIKRGAIVINSIVGWKAKVGEWARIEDYSVIGAGAEVQERICISQGKVLPGSYVSAHIPISSLAPIFN